jgi:hypothetical protein
MRAWQPDYTPANAVAHRRKTVHQATDSPDIASYRQADAKSSPIVAELPTRPVSRSCAPAKAGLGRVCHAGG